MEALASFNGADGLVLDRSVLAPPDTLGGAEISTLTPDYIDEHCPYTIFGNYMADLQYTLPKFLVFTNVFEKVVCPATADDPSNGCPAGSDLVINVDDGTGPQGPHHVYLGFAIACANLAVRPVFLAPDPAASVDAKGNRVIRPYEQDFDYFCLKFRKTASKTDVPAWYCGTGNLADGVTGIASVAKPTDPSGLSRSPATFFLNQIQWGPNVWNMHWEFPHGLGAISARIPPNEQTGFAKDYQWNINPNDWHSNGDSKVLEYIAAVGVKTATNRDGVYVSPYNTHHLTAYFQDWFRLHSNFASPPLDTVAYAAQIDPSELNQGEVETRSCQAGDPTQCFAYFNNPDVASTGHIGTIAFGVIDISAGPYYRDNYDCTWRYDWHFPSLDTLTAGYVRPEPLAGTNAAGIGTILPLVTTPFAVAINLGDHEMSRCPTWNLCQTAGTQPIVHLYGEDSNLRVLPGAQSGVLIPPNQDGARACSDDGIFQCQQVLCGRPILVTSSESPPQTRDWWLRSSAGQWQLGCSGTTSCTVTVTDDLAIVGVSGVPEDAVASAISQQTLP
jgi:hypothetical protein